MKKTLALALVAAMTISMASMTAFAKTEYNSDSQVAEPEEVVAQVTYKADDDKVVAEKSYTKYKLKEGVADTEVNVTVTAGAVTAEDYAKLDAATKDKLEPDKSTEVTTYKIKFSDIGLKKYENTATRTFKGWHQDDAVAGDLMTATNTNWSNEEECKVTVKGDDDMITLTKNGDKLQAQFSTAGRIDKTDESIAKNLKAIEDAKNNGDAAQKEKDRMADLDKQYNADGKNGYDKSTKEDKELQGKATQKKKGDTGVGMDDFYTHAANVAGAPVDETKTWVYDVTLPDNTALYSGKTARTTIALDGVKDSADLSKFGVKVYHIEGWCKATKVKNVDVKGNKVTFWSDSFSPYVITLGDGVASTGADASNPSTGDFSAVPVALLAAAALGATGFVAYKKRKAE